MIELNVKAKKALPWSAPLTHEQATQFIEEGRAISMFRKGTEEKLDWWSPANPINEETMTKYGHKYDWRVHDTHRAVLLQQVVVKRLSFTDEGVKEIQQFKVLQAHSMRGLQNQKENFGEKLLKVWDGSLRWVLLENINGEKVYV